MEVMDKSYFIRKAVQWAEQRGYKKVKANCEEYESPTEYKRAEDDQPFVPDATGVLGGKKSYFEIALKTENERRRITKWKLLGTLAHMKGGKLYLLTPKGHKAFTEGIVKQHLLNAEVVYLKGA